MKAASTTTAVTFQHRDVALLAPAAELLPAVISGAWGQVAAVCADALTDPARTAKALDQLAAGSGMSFGSFEAFACEQSGDRLTWHTTPAVAAAALDLFQRVLVGQWSEVAWVAQVSAREVSAADLSDALRLLRQGHAKVGAYPDHPGASWSISAGPLASRLAYLAWKALGAGTPDRPTFALPGGDLVVTTT